MQTRSPAISLITEGPFIGIIGALRRTITVAPPLPPTWTVIICERDWGVTSCDHRATGRRRTLTWEVQREQLESTDRNLQPRVQAGDLSGGSVVITKWCICVNLHDTVYILTQTDPILPPINVVCGSLAGQRASFISFGARSPGQCDIVAKEMTKCDAAAP